MLALSPRLIGVVAIAGFAVFAYWRYDFVVKDRDAARQELASTKGVLEKERQTSQEAANRALAFRLEESAREKELNDLRDCVAAGKCGVRLRYQACPKLPDTSASGQQAAGGIAEPEREFQQWYFSHSALIDKYETRIKALQEDVRARSHPGACNPNKLTNKKPAN